jgi:tetratricopeptide (TPR) repeat protein
MRLTHRGFVAIFVLFGFLPIASQTQPTTPGEKPVSSSEKPVAGSEKGASGENALDAQIEKAREQLRQGNLDAARDAAAAALTIKGDSPSANLLMGNVLFHRGEIAQANEYIQKTLKIAPDDPQAWLALSRVAHIVSLNKKAVACINKAYSLAPDDHDVLLAWANSRPKRTEAIVAFERLLELQKKQPDSKTEWIQRRIDALKQLGDTETDVLTSPVAHYDVPIDYVLYDSEHLQGWGVKVAIGNCKPVKLMIDTGASGILIGDSLAEKCGVKKLYQGFITGIGSKPPVGIYTGLADHLQLGPVEYKNVLVDVENRTPVGDESGLIGTDLLDQFLINLNLSDYKLTLDPLPPIPGDDGKPGPKDRYIAPQMASYAKVFVVQDHLLIPTKVGSDTSPVLFMIDTGAGNNVIADQYVGKLQKLSKEDYIEIKGVQGKVQKVFSADDLTLQFAGFRQMNQRLIAHPLGTINEIQFSGLLGLPILRWFTLHIDYRDGLVGFEYHEPHGVDTKRLR